MSATPNDEQSLRILEAIGRRCRPYTDRDIARATRLSQRVVQRRLRLLADAGLVELPPPGRRARTLGAHLRASAIPQR
ncbi:MAG: winged helix-turn-helix transcriptional regulator [Planctomycetaceae bacterium]|nr:winged helix-turn-helix transcriptional regulator [Planctomycetaceae bacterium]